MECEIAEARGGVGVGTISAGSDAISSPMGQLWLSCFVRNLWYHVSRIRAIEFNSAHLGVDSSI
jgi:hypothetical protein